MEATVEATPVPTRTGCESDGAVVRCGGHVPPESMLPMDTDTDAGQSRRIHLVIRTGIARMLL